jgi:outer membrane protein
MQVGLLDRRLDLGGFTPRILYTYTRNDSRISLFAFHRNRIEFGVTTSF